MTTESSMQDGELAATISNTVVRALARTTGRGPTKAKTTLGDNGVFVVLQDTLTRGEQTLTDAGEGVAVLDLRRRWQRVMQADVSREIEELTGRKVIGFMSDNHIDPDLAVEVFVLEPLPERGRSLSLAGRNSGSTRRWAQSAAQGYLQQSQASRSGPPTLLPDPEANWTSHLRARGPTRDRHRRANRPLPATRPQAA